MIFYGNIGTIWYQKTSKDIKGLNKLLRDWGEFTSEALQIRNGRSVARRTLCRAATTGVHHCRVWKATASTLEPISDIWQRTRIRLTNVSAGREELAAAAFHFWIVWRVSSFA